MQPFRDVPDVSAAPDGLLSGHLWLYEAVVGAPFRFQLQPSGRLRVGDADREYDPEDVPPQYRHVVRHVRETCDWAALRSAVDDVSSVVFFGHAMQHRGLDYDWTRTPAFLGSDVWNGATGDFLGVDAVEHVFERLGLDSLNTVAKEVRAADFDPTSYEFPTSAWYDGPVAGVVLRNKRGGCARLDNPAVTVSTRTPDDALAADQSPEALAADLVTSARVRQVVSRLEARGYPVTFDAVYDRLLQTLFREHPPDAFTGDVDGRAFRSAVAERTRDALD
ncbi:hypothetical protein SAMN04487949_2975 [Halogranum gelatinilyticum]|uniref:Uncharacterized protein n=1 Tax=Halogranum gelatinilyticum TaxID=660521 RepID=A0A1G9XGI6_9EURY|nr:hypothetical protein [Halogranum gelatinilyticum]SDM95641.1 hypothetical protein SAMN04487949_2975 [Halogranum gelatinilyticum]